MIRMLHIIIVGVLFFLFVLACVQTSELSGSLVRPKFFEEEPS